MTAGLFALLASLGFSQQIIENPDKPLAKNAGRVLKLEKIWGVEDAGGNFYFKQPADLRVAPDGSVFVVDEFELLKFSAQGQFLRNLYKNGQGPGELTSDLPAIAINGKELIVYDFMTRNLLAFDSDGNLVRQIRIDTGPYNGFYGAFGDRLVFGKEIFPAAAERKPGRQNMPVEIRSIRPDGQSEKIHGRFMKDMVIQGNRFMTWTGYSTAMDEAKGRFYVAATREYGIEVIDLATESAARVFKRKYQSIPYRNRGWEENFYKTNDVPRIKIEKDIRGLFATGGSLWARTSKTDPKSGDLFDVFDEEGRFRDSFFLGAGKSLLKVIGNEVYVTEKNPDESLVLVKYRIREEGR